MVYKDRPTSTLFARRRRQRRFATHAAAHVDDLGRMADLQHVERVGVVVDVRDGLAGVLDDHVALLQSRLLRWPAAYDPAEQQTLGLARVVGDRAGEYAHARAAAARLHLLVHFRE